MSSSRLSLTLYLIFLSPDLTNQIKKIQTLFNILKKYHATKACKRQTLSMSINKKSYLIYAKPKDFIAPIEFLSTYI